MCHVFAGDASFYRRIGVPSLLVYGLKDPVISLVEMCEMERTIPKSYLELIPLAGHDVMSDQPKSINVMMRKFIEKYSWPRPWTYLKRGNNSHIPSKPSKRHNYPIWCIEEIEEIWNATVLFVLNTTIELVIFMIHSVLRNFCIFIPSTIFQVIINTIILDKRSTVYKQEYLTSSRISSI